MPATPPPVRPHRRPQGNDGLPMRVARGARPGCVSIRSGSWREPGRRRSQPGDPRRAGSSVPLTAVTTALHMPAGPSARRSVASASATGISRPFFPGAGILAMVFQRYVLNPNVTVYRFGPPRFCAGCRHRPLYPDDQDAADESTTFIDSSLCASSTPSCACSSGSVCDTKLSKGSVWR